MPALNKHGSEGEASTSTRGGEKPGAGEPAAPGLEPAPEAASAPSPAPASLLIL